MAGDTRAASNIRTIHAAGEPTAPSALAGAFYEDALRELSKLALPFLLGGTYALSVYTGITRATKDLDILCKPSDYPRIIERFKSLGYAIEIEDERWLAKVFRGEVFGIPVRVIAPTELIWSKAFVQLRHRYDGADSVHLILKQHDRIDWRRLLAYMDLHWEVLLVHLLNFRWAYPSEREYVPRWLMDELMGRLERQLELPPPRVKICRGRMFSHIDYEPAVKDWGFTEADEGGELGYGGRALHGHLCGHRRPARAGG